mgnify:CR=1 FL=1
MPEQNGAIAAKSDVFAGITVTTNVWPVLQILVGVNVYVALFILSIVAGDQIPDTPFGATADNNGAVLPAQNGAIEAKFDVADAEIHHLSLLLISVLSNQQSNINKHQLCKYFVLVVQIVNV